jgi:hypothetical protein
MAEEKKDNLNKSASFVSEQDNQSEKEQDIATTVQEEQQKYNNNNNNSENSTVLGEDTKSQLVKAFADVTKVSSSQAEEYLENANWELQTAVRQYFDNNENATIGESSVPTADSIAAHITEIRKKASELSIIAQQKAKENLGFVGQGVSKGWGTLNRLLDNVFHMKEEGEEDSSRKRYADMTTQDWEVELRKAFPSWNKENSLIDAFPCSLMQRYRCVDNKATEEQIIEFPGVLFITVGKVAFHGSSTDSDKFGVIIGLDEISRIQKGKESRIRLVLKDQTCFIFSQFKDQVEFESALGILEQIWESSHQHMTNTETTPTTNKNVEESTNS